MRLDRLLVTLGQGSRSQVQKVVRAGKVTVNGQTVRDPSAEVPENAPVVFDGNLLDTRLARHLMLHKPAGILTAARDPKQPTVMDLLPAEMRTLGCMPVGRLDKDTTGLLLFTTDGTLAHRLLAPERHVEKEYLAEVDGPLTERDIRAFAEGLDLGDFTAMPARLEILASGSGSARARVVIGEGKFHQVKRMFEAVGRKVTSLHRERFGPLTLGELPRGEWRELTAEELSEIRESAGMI